MYIHTCIYIAIYIHIQCIFSFFNYNAVAVQYAQGQDGGLIFSGYGSVGLLHEYKWLRQLVGVPLYDLNSVAFQEEVEQISF